jgi:hypothetical protein
MISSPLFVGVLPEIGRMPKFARKNKDFFLVLPG